MDKYLEYYQFHEKMKKEMQYVYIALLKKKMVKLPYNLLKIMMKL